MVLSARTALLLVSFALVLLPWLVWRLPGVRRVAPLAVLQILAGLLLGPTGLGAALPSVHAALFTAPVLASVNGLATVGVLLFVFIAGLHLDAARLRAGLRQLGPMMAGSVGLPLALGAAAGAWIVATVPGADGARGSGAVAAAGIAICLAVTALPVLAAILGELGLLGSPFGQTALALAALNDAALWLMIAVLLALAQGDAAGAARCLGLTALWLLTMVLAVRPLLAAAARRGGEQAVLVLALATCFASAAATEAFGLGYLIGGFVAGAVMPGPSRAALLARLEPLTAGALLPFFFVATGLRATVEAGSPAFMGLLVLLTLVAAVGKVVGTAVPARRHVGGWRPALALGALMQSKGLMEVVVLTVLLDDGLIGATVFSAMVSMAVVCTLVAAPAVRLLLSLPATVDGPGN